MTFKEAYKFPLSVLDGTVWTRDENMAFMFANNVLADDPHILSWHGQFNVVKSINGYEADLAPLELSYNPKDATISLNGKTFLIIRGWGHLTGSGGLNLPEDTATRLQDEFAEYIIKQLS
jgi:hypothetical protein